MSLAPSTARWQEGEREYAEAVQEALSEKSRLMGRAMSYRDFTFDEVTERFNLRIEERVGAFASIAAQSVSALLQQWLQRSVPLALAMPGERGRAELIIAPVLAEVREQLRQQISLFSGHSFMVDEEQGLAGFPDYLLTRSPDQFRLQAPVLVVVEGKGDVTTEGIPQCLAAMVAAQLFNRRAGTDQPAIYGAITTGNNWRFMSLTGTDVTIDLTEYYINEVERIVGILCHMLSADTPNLTP